MADPSYPAIARSYAVSEVELSPCRQVRDRATSSTARRFAHAWTDRTRAVMLASPSNPTGTSIPFDELAAICELTRSRNGWRIVDEIYLELADPDESGMPPGVC